MAKRYDFVSDITPIKETWKIKIRVLKMWKTPKFMKPEMMNSIDAILIDEQDNTIELTGKRQYITSIERKMHEGKCYLLQNFNMGQNVGCFKASPHPYKIIWNDITSQKEIKCSSIKEEFFDFKDFVSITSNKEDVDTLVDVIGDVSGMGEIGLTNFKSGQGKLLNIQLSDLGKNLLNVTLWDSFAQQMFEYAKNNLGRIIAILKKGKIKEYKEFRSRLLVGNPVEEATITNLSTSSMSSSIDDFFRVELKKNSR